MAASSSSSSMSVETYGEDDGDETKAPSLKCHLCVPPEQLFNCAEFREPLHQHHIRFYHLNQHKPFKCAVCNKAFTIKLFLDMHIEKDHNGQAARKVGGNNGLLDALMNAMKLSNELVSSGKREMALQMLKDLQVEIGEGGVVGEEGAVGGDGRDGEKEVGDGQEVAAGQEAVVGQEAAAGEGEAGDGVIRVDCESQMVEAGEEVMGTVWGGQIGHDGEREAVVDEANRDETESPMDEDGTFGAGQGKGGEPAENTGYGSGVAEEAGDEREAVVDEANRDEAESPMVEDGAFGIGQGKGGEQVETTGYGSGIAEEAGEESDDGSVEF